MKKVLFYVKFLPYLFVPLVVFTLLSGTLNYFSVLNYKVTSILNFIFVIMLFMYIGIKVGKKSEAKGYINGLILGLLATLIFMFLSLVTASGIKISSLIYFAILNISSIFGGMIGINSKNKNTV